MKPLSEGRKWGRGLRVGTLHWAFSTTFHTNAQVCALTYLLPTALGPSCCSLADPAQPLHNAQEVKNCSPTPHASPTPSSLTCLFSALLATTHQTHRQAVVPSNWAPPPQTLNLSLFNSPPPLSPPNPVPFSLADITSLSSQTFLL